MLWVFNDLLIRQLSLIGYKNYLIGKKFCQSLISSLFKKFVTSNRRIFHRNCQNESSQKGNHFVDKTFNFNVMADVINYALHVCSALCETSLSLKAYSGPSTPPPHPHPKENFFISSNIVFFSRN